MQPQCAINRCSGDKSMHMRILGKELTENPPVPGHAPKPATTTTPYQIDKTVQPGTFFDYKRPSVRKGTPTSRITSPLPHTYIRYATSVSGSLLWA